MRLIEPNTQRFRVVGVALPKATESEQELVPVLIDERTGLPPRLALRWVMRSRRVSVSEKTLTDDLRGASLLYAFCEDELESSLDDLFSEGHRLDANELEKLIAYLREGSGGTTGVRALSTTGQLISNIERFLKWLAEPIDRGGKSYFTAESVVLYREQLKYSFEEVKKFRSRGERKPPLTAEQDEMLAASLDPIRTTDGVYKTPLAFSKTSPWKPQTRLRNWIAYRLGRELGLRRGEIGKIRIDDVKNKGGPVVTVRRRANDPADTRKSSNRPKVKTVERELPISGVLSAGIRQYIHTAMQDGGRRGADTPYLLVTEDGAPISGTSLDCIWKAVNHRLGTGISWHTLRHTWAEETADDLLGKYEGSGDASTLALEILREIGGWAPNSNTPFVYIKDAIKKRGNAYLRRRNAKFDVEAVK